ncbi:MAG: GTPase HflX [Patescibacteria group bacterium]
MHITSTQLKAVLVDVITPQTTKAEAEIRLYELENLVNTFGGLVVVKTIQKRGLPDYDTYVGKGKLDEIIAEARENGANLLILNNILKPKQIYNLDEYFREAKIEMKAWDRVDLILKIFDKHAKTTEAKLQIELAAIKHMGPRIYGMGIELSQQSGAVGIRSGQGETNTELMKRHLRNQELNIIDKLKHYDLINKGHRERRKRQNFKSVAIVGYTNAGKSSLLNALTGKDVYIADKLFATLDTRIGKIYIPPKQHIQADGQYIPGKEILISDTIGFIRDLPPLLIQAFKSTLAEAIDADLVLHVVDINDKEMHTKIDVVEEILNQLGLTDRQRIYAFNKVDMMAHRIHFEDKRKLKSQLQRKTNLVKAGEYSAAILGWTSSKKGDAAKKSVTTLKRKYKKFDPVFVSAHKKINLEQLIEKLSKYL